MEENLDSGIQSEKVKSDFEELAEQMYFDEKSDGKESVYFSVAIFQTVLCVIMTVVIFLMAFFGPFKKKIIEATDYFQSFELTKNDIKSEIEAMKDFLSDAEI